MLDARLPATRSGLGDGLGAKVVGKNPRGHGRRARVPLGQSVIGLIAAMYIASASARPSKWGGVLEVFIRWVQKRLTERADARRPT